MSLFCEFGLLFNNFVVKNQSMFEENINQTLSVKSTTGWDKNFHNRIRHVYIQQKMLKNMLMFIFVATCGFQTVLTSNPSLFSFSRWNPMKVIGGVWEHVVCSYLYMYLHTGFKKVTSGHVCIQTLINQISLQATGSMNYYSEVAHCYNKWLRDCVICLNPPSPLSIHTKVIQCWMLW